ncbi:MAG: hypothetical protein AB2A00_38240 [Myxococcota bacterium]
MKRICLLASLLLSGGCTSHVLVEHFDFVDNTDTFSLVYSYVDSFLNANEGLPLPYNPAIDTLEGKRVVIRGGGQVAAGDPCRGMLTPDVASLSRDDFYALHIVARPTQVNLQYNIQPVVLADGSVDNAVIPADHDSLAMLTAYVHLDRVQAFLRDVLKDDSRAATTRAVGLFDPEAVVSCSVPGLGGPSVPLILSDNAAYNPSADVFILLRDALPTAEVALGTNPGVLAHEFGHRVFEQNLYISDEAFRRKVQELYGGQDFCTDDTPDDEIDDCKASTLLQKGINEGFADIIAYTYMGRPDFGFTRSLSYDENEPSTRDRNFAVELDPERDFIIYDEAYVRQAEEGTLSYYFLGTLFGRGFYHGITNPQTGAAPVDEDERVELARTVYTPAMLRALRRLGEDYLVNARFDPRQVIRRFLQELPATTGNDARSGMCQAMCDRFGRLEYPAPVNNVAAQCTGFTGKNALVKNGGTFPCQL